ncbi:MAG: ATP-binding cassette domain-containing protein [Planctomycetes bacterium]|nr:ATP-binding cassette domain-containing protein [Planctomycetota bacterium]
MIEMRGVWKKLGSREILRGLDLVVPEGLNYVLMGRSGTGKSVTLKHVIGILRPDAGSVKVDGVEVAELKRRELQELRKKMGYLFQNGALINWLTIEENVALPLVENTTLPRSEIADRVHETLVVVGMDHAAKQFPPDVSGGMKLRAGLARALVGRPRYVLYDEPNAGLDPIMARQIHELIAHVRDRYHVTGLLVTHSRQCALDTGDRIGVLDGGRIVAEGSMEEMWQSPHPLVQSFLSGHAD